MSGERKRGIEWHYGKIWWHAGTQMDKWRVGVIDSGGSVILISFSLGASVYVCAFASLAASWLDFWVSFRPQHALEQHKVTGEVMKMNVCVCVSEKAAFLLRLRSGLLIKMPARPLRNPTLLSSLLFPHLSSFPPFPIPFISVHSSCMSTGMSFWFLSSFIVFIKYNLTANIFLTFLCTVCCIYVCVWDRELKVQKTV